jgi:putative transcriptional regulator
MIRCHLSSLMGKKKVKIADLARDLDLNRSTLTALYYDRAQKVDLEAIEKLCGYFDCKVGDLLEVVAGQEGKRAERQ